jgi:hypothetical protein
VGHGVLVGAVVVAVAGPALAGQIADGVVGVALGVGPAAAAASRVAVVVLGEFADVLYPVASRHCQFSLQSLYPKHNIVKILVRVPIIAAITKAFFYLFDDHTCAATSTIYDMANVSVIPDVPDVDVPILCVAAQFDGFRWHLQP